jgi:hypothetical protein
MNSALLRIPANSTPDEYQNSSAMGTEKNGIALERAIILGSETTSAGVSVPARMAPAIIEEEE